MRLFSQQQRTTVFIIFSAAIARRAKIFAQPGKREREGKSIISLYRLPRSMNQNKHSAAKTRGNPARTDDEDFLCVPAFVFVRPKYTDKTAPRSYYRKSKISRASTKKELTSRSVTAPTHILAILYIHTVSTYDFSTVAHV